MNEKDDLQILDTINKCREIKSLMSNRFDVNAKKILRATRQYYHDKLES